jgi:hypothetical protein
VSPIPPTSRPTSAPHSARAARHSKSAGLALRTPERPARTSLLAYEGAAMGRGTVGIRGWGWAARVRRATIAFRATACLARAAPTSAATLPAAACAKAAALTVRAGFATIGAAPPGKCARRKRRVNRAPHRREQVAQTARSVSKVRASMACASVIAFWRRTAPPMVHVSTSAFLAGDSADAAGATFTLETQQGS